MTQPTILVERIRFDLQASTVPGGRNAIERVSAFGRQRLPIVLTEVLDKVEESQRDRHFDLVELDLGELPAWRLERALEERIERMLSDYLHRAGCIAMPAAAEAPVASARDRDPDWIAIGSYLEGRPVRKPAPAFAAALGRWPLDLRRLLYLHGRHQMVRQRLAQDLPAGALHALVRILEPVEAVLIIAYVGDVSELHRQRPLAPEGQRVFGMVMWEFVLAYLLLERGSYFNTRSFIEHTLRQLAGRYRLDYGVLLTQMTSCLTGHVPYVSDAPGLRTMLLELQGKEAHAAPADAPLPGRLQRIASLLERGVWSGPSARPATLESLIAEALDEDGDSLGALLRRCGKRHQVRHRLAGQLGEASRRRVVDLLEPAHGPWIGKVVDTVQSEQERRRIVHEDRNRFRARLWEFVFCALLVDRGSYFNNRSFIRSLVAQMAAHYNVAYRVLLNGLIGTQLPAGNLAVRRRGLLAILLSLKDEVARAASPGVEEPPAGPAIHKLVRGLTLRHALGGGLRFLLANAIRDGAARAGQEYGAWLTAVLQQKAAFQKYQVRRQELGEILLALGEELEAGEPSHAAPSRTPAHFERAAREFVLRSFQLERGSYFNNRSYIKQLLQQLSARHAIAYGILLHGLLERTAIAGAPAASLPAILRELRAESLPAQPAGAWTPSTAVSTDQAGGAIWNYLRNGSLPGDASILLRDGLASLDAAALAAALRDAAFPFSMLERLLRYLPDDRLLQLVDCLAEGAGGLASTWRMAVLALLERLPALTNRTASLEVAAWRVIFRVLLAAPAGEFSGAVFVAAVTRQLAPRLGLAPATLRGHLMAVAAGRVGSHARYRILLDLLGRDGALVMKLPRSIPATVPAAPPPVAAGDGMPAHLRFGAGAALPADMPGQLEQLLAREPGVVRTWLRALGGRQLECARLVSWLTPAQLQSVLALLLGGDAAQFVWWSEALAAAASETGGGSDWDKRLHALLLAHALRAPGSKPPLHAFLLAALRMLQGGRGVPGPAMWRNLQVRAARAGAVARPALELVERILTTASTASARTSAADDTDSPAPGERFTIDNAGVVLLWPFLDRYFSMLGMLTDGLFTDVGQQHRAVELLRFLTHGTQAAAEHEQLLNKILCGLAPEEPLLAGNPLSEQELDLSAQVLHVVTQHWEKLKNTDIDGLRMTFLRRTGHLERLEGSWKLEVPRETFDVLLGSLPWALSTVKLSWMKSLLTVEWA